MAWLKTGDVHKAMSRDFRKGYSLVSIPSTWPAIFTGKPSLRGKRFRTPMPLAPRTALSHWVFISIPRGDTASYPTITGRVLFIPVCLGLGRKGFPGHYHGMNR